MSCPSATFTVWASAWLAGAAALDDALDALAPWADAHDVQAVDIATAATTQLPSPGAPVGSVTFLLAALRRAGRGAAGPARLVLPAPGDVRGLPPGPAPFRRGVLDAGEGVLFAEAGLGLVPAPVADGVLRWTVHAVAEPGPTPEFVAVAQAERELSDQVRRSTSTLTELGVARHRPGVREEIAAALKARPPALWPAGMPTASLRVLQRADEVEAIVAAAWVDDPGGALSASAAAARREALQPLESAVRVARRASVAEAVRVLAASPLV